MITNVMERLIDFTRTSGGGYFGSDGLFRFTPASRNLLTYTQEFDVSTWSKAAVTVTANMITAPDGTLTADAVLPTATTAAHSVQQAGGGFGSPLALSVYAKAGSHAFMQLSHGSLSAIYANFNLLTGEVGAVGANATASIVPAGDGWYRCTMTFAPGSTANIAIGHVTSASSGHRESWAATGTESIYLWGAQLEAVPDANLVLGSELVTNGDFSGGSTGWTLNPGWAVTGSELVGSAAAFASAFQSVGLTVGRSYLVTYTITSYTSGSVRGIFVGGTQTNGTARSSAGTFTETMTAVTGNATFAIQSAASGFVGAVDNISVREITDIIGMPTTYTRNVGGLFPPRFDYDPVTLAPRGLLIEEQRTNLLLRSEEFDNASWVKIRSSLTASTTTSPDGTVDADKLVEDTTAAATHIISQNIASHTSGVAYTMTVYAKAAERSQIRVNGDVAIGLSIPAIFDLSSGTVVSAGSFTASIQNAGNGWYRCVCTGTATATSAGSWFVGTAVAGNTSYTGDGTSGLFLWGAQLEAGAFATSYIPTQASQVTRASDNATITGANFSRWYNQTSGTFLVEWRQGGSEAVQIAASVNDGTANNIMSVLNDNSSAAGVTPGAAVTNGGVAQANLTGAAITAGSTNKTALAYALNDFAYSQNGAAALTDTSGTIPTVGRLDIGNRVSALFTNGHIRRIKYYPARLSNAQIQALTA